MKFGAVFAGIAAAIVAAEGAYAAVRGASETLLRPPGAQSEADFLSRCIKCGKCLEACPYQAIRMASALEGAAAGTPIIVARDQACRMCEDFPCVAACPTGALRDCASRNEVHMGTAVIDEDVCIAFTGMRCEVCYRTCPKIDEAITIDYQKLEGDAIHSVFAPVINADACTGCGLCVERCVVSEPKVPISIAPFGSAAEESENV